MPKRPTSRKKYNKKETPVESTQESYQEKDDEMMIAQEIVEEVAVVKRRKERGEPRMTHKAVWLIYAEVLRTGAADEVFDTLARTFETRGDLGYWLYRIGMGPKLIKLGKGRDMVQYFRAVAHTLFQDTRHEAQCLTSDRRQVSR